MWVGGFIDILVIHPFLSHVQGYPEEIKDLGRGGARIEFLIQALRKQEFIVKLR